MNESKPRFFLDMPACDWLTLTNYSYPTLRTLFELAAEGKGVEEGIKRMQYMGRQSERCFLGTAEQNGKAHSMLQLSGSLADLMIPEVIQLRAGEKCTRIDLQITCKSSMDLFDLAARKKRGRRTIGYIESGGLATCYIGSFKSDKLIRIYNKERGIVRFEIMYKGGRAHPILEALETAENWRVKVAEFLKWEITSVNDPALDAAFLPALAANAEGKPPTAHRSPTSTDKWLREVVLPVLYKYVNSHDADQVLIHAYKLALFGDEKENE